MNKKKIAVILAGSIVTCALNTTNVYATEITPANETSVESSLSTSEKLPNVGVQQLTFTKNEPKDLVITNVDFGDTQLKSFSIDAGNYSISLSDISLTESSITIPATVIANLNLEEGLHSTRIEFENGGLFINTVKINVVKTETTVTPPDEVIEETSIEKQILNYDIYTPSQVVVNNIDFNGTTLKSIRINDTLVYPSEIEIGTNSVTIPADVISRADVTCGIYDISFKFSDNSIVASKVFLNVTDSTPTPELPPVTDEFEDTDSNPVLPPVIEDSSNDDNGVVETPSEDNSVTDDDLLPPAGDSQDTDTEDSMTEVPPVIDGSEDTIVDESTIVIDKNNPTSVEIDNFIPANTVVDSIKINNKEVRIVYLNSRVRAMADLPVVYVINNKLVIPTETLEYIGFDTPKYKIDVTLVNGQTLSKTVALDIVDSSNESEDPDSTPSTDNNNTSAENNNSVTENSEETVINNIASSSSTSVNKTQKTEISSASNSAVPKTGSAAVTSLTGSFLASIAGIFATRKKNK